MSNGLEKSTLYIDLDALLDTRVATIASFGDDKPLIAVQKGYYDRDVDVFPDIDPEIYDLKYRQRHKSILKDALITPMGGLVNEFTINTIMNISTTPFHYQPKVIVNVYPYELTDDETVVIIQSVVNLTKGNADVQSVNLSDEQLSPSYVKNNINLFIRYEYLNWFETHTLNLNFKKVTLPSVVMMVPKLYPKVLSSKDKIDFFPNMEKLMAPIINLKYMPVDLYSFVKITDGK